MDEEKFDYLFGRLSRIEEADTENLRRIIHEKIRKRHRRRRFIRLARNSAAIVLPVLLGGAVWLYLSGGLSGSVMNGIAQAEESVRLTMSDGSEIVLDRGGEDRWILEHDNVVMTLKDGTLISENRINGSLGDGDAVYASLEIPKGKRFDIVLGDGTHVWLNAGSQLRFPVEFSGNERRVFLKGEGYFEVSGDRSKPFIVNAADNEIVVLGTTFNITAYENDNEMVATLISGSVEVVTPAGSAILLPGHQAVITQGEDEIVIRTVDPAVYSSWITGLLDFDGLKLEDICARLERWYGVSFIFEGDTINDRFSGGAWMDQSLWEFLKNIEQASDVIFREKDGKIIVSAKR